MTMLEQEEQAREEADAKAATAEQDRIAADQLAAKSIEDLK